MAKPKTTKTQAPARRHGIQSVEVAGPLLAALAAVEAPLMLKDLAAAAHMPAAKAHRYLVSLSRLGLVSQDAATGRYDLGPFALELGVAALGRLDAARPANDAAEKLRDDLGETVVLAVWGPLGVTLVRIAEPVRAITVSMRAGAVAPLTASAAGLLFAAYLPPATTAAALKRELDANRKSGNLQAPSTREALDRLLEEVRAVGMSRRCLRPRREFSRRADFRSHRTHRFRPDHHRLCRAPGRGFFFTRGHSAGASGAQCVCAAWIPAESRQVMAADRRQSRAAPTTINSRPAARISTPPAEPKCSSRSMRACRGMHLGVCLSALRATPPAGTEGWTLP